jgi:formylglycine-generating enzyme required for sulfatase activity
MGQGGNVCEWNEDAWNASRVLRGGAWSDDLFRLASSNRDGYHPDFEDWIIGFRVASVPEPGSLVMLAGIALTALLYRWRKRA